MAKELNNGPPPNPEHPECETIPIEQFSKASWDRSNRIIGLLRRHTELADDTEDQIRTCVQEVIQNVVDHAQSEIGGVMSARYIDSSRELRVAIVDRGRGIAASLRQQYADTTTSFIALQRVVAGHYSSRSRPNNMGIGISNLFGLIRAAHGRIAVFSGDALAEVHGGSSPRVDQLREGSFPGTAVFFTVPIV
ncbi:MAG: ATP-binding protein [Phycisphaerales bacterium]